MVKSPRKSEREQKSIDRLMYCQTIHKLLRKHNFSQVNGEVSQENIKYDDNTATVIAKKMRDLEEKIRSRHVWAQQYNLKKRLHKFGTRGVEAIREEMEQLHTHKCFMPKK